MECIRAGRACRGDHGIDVEQVERTVAGGLGDDRPHAQAVAGSRDAGRDLAAIGDEQGADRLGWRWPGRYVCSDERVNRVTCDTPPPSHTPGRESAGGDPPLDGPRRRTDSRSGLAWT